MIKFMKVTEDTSDVSPPAPNGNREGPPMLMSALSCCSVSDGMALLKGNPRATDLDILDTFEQPQQLGDTPDQPRHL